MTQREFMLRLENLLNEFAATSEPQTVVHNIGVSWMDTSMIGEQRGNKRVDGFTIEQYSQGLNQTAVRINQ